MAEMLSPCCGAEFTDGTDEEGYEVYECNDCKELFYNPIEDYEYGEQMKESIAEDRADEARDMGL